MTATVEAIYEDGKLVLTDLLPLPEKSRVTVRIEMDARHDPERAEWLRVSEDALRRTWDNSDDDVFNALLQE